MADEAPAQPQDQPDDASVSEPASTEEPQGFDPSQLPEEAQQYLTQREREMQGDYTRKTQELAEERQQVEYAQALLEAAQDPNHPQQAEARAALGWAPEEDDDEDEYVDETEALRAEVAEMKEFLLQQGQEAQNEAEQAAEDDFIVEKLDALQEKEGRAFDEKELILLVSVATGNRKQDGEPDFELAYETLNDTYSARQKDWMTTKRAPRAPGGGPAARRQFDVNDPKQRLDAAIAAAEAAGAD